MTKYKLDVSFDSTRGMVTLNVFDLDSDESGKIDSCSVGEDLDSGEILDAWARYHEKSAEKPPSEQLFDQIRSLIEENTHDELASRQADLKEQREQLENEFGVPSLQMFRENLLEEEDLSATELRERKNIESTWEALNTEVMLLGHAMQMYQDVSELEVQGNSH